MVADWVVECKLCGCSWNPLARCQHCPSCGLSFRREPPFLRPAIERSKWRLRGLLKAALRKILA